jgi:DNA-directed RNA polymerase beta' subunit
MTLNSVDWEDKITYKMGDKIIENHQIGKLIDGLMSDYNDKIKKIEDKPNIENTETEYLDVSELNMTVPTVDENGKTSWKLIEAVTRHLPGHDGMLVRIETKLGRKVSATKSKSFLTLINNKITEIEGSEIKVGTLLPIDINSLSGDEIKIINNDKNKIINDVYMDEIKSLEYVKPSHEKVYDLTVAETRNFTMADGLCMRDTFHSTGSGVAGMQGVPRFRELLSYTKNPGTPYMVIYMDKENKTNKEHAHRIASTLKYTILNELAQQMDIIYDPDAKTRVNSYYNVDDIDRDSVFYLNNVSGINVNNMPWVFRVTLSRENIVDNEITMLDIKSKFITFWNNYYSDLSNLKKQAKDVITKILHGCVMTTFDSSDELIVHFRFEFSNVDNHILLYIQDVLLNKFNIKGNENISKISKIDNQHFVSYENEDKMVETSKEWAIYTEGIDLNAIRNIIGIDINRTSCNDVHQIYQTFGIEAAKSALIREFENVFDGNNVNFAHVLLLVDVMTNNGGITSIDRHGINRLDTDPMGRASFEKTIEQLLLAAAFNEVDYLRGVSSRIMVGKCIKGGTGLCDLLVDIDMLENSELDETKESKIVGSKFKPLKTNSLLDDLLKNIPITGAKIFMPK